MSFYNMLFGKNPDTNLTLALIGLKEWDIERFRDCGISDGQISVYTRTGGGNRDDYPNEVLTSNPYYKYDEDDAFDSTYATYYFNIPEEIAEDVGKLSDIESFGITGNLIKWINKTLHREPTESDKRREAYEKSREVFDRLIRNGDVTFPHNGHTCIILSDSGAEACFRMAEQKTMFYYAAPLKIRVTTNDYKYRWDKEKGGIGQHRLAIEPESKWPMDTDAVDRYMKLFAEKYPNGARYLEKQWRR